MTHLSLFSGIAGIDIAAHWAGFQTVQFVERDQFCQKVLAKNFPGVPIHDDITTFDGRGCRGVDLVSAGFPCQPHSLAGKRLASGDERDLWGEVVRVLGEAKPRWFLGENVPGLLSSESGRFFGRVVNDLAEMGYRVGWCVYGACDVGAVHRRNRVFIVAWNSDNERCEEFNHGKSTGAGDIDCGVTTNSLNFRRNDIQEKGLDGQNDQEREARRAKQSQGGGVLQDATDTNCIPRSQTSEAVDSIRSGRHSWDYVGGSDWGLVRGGNWKRWGVEPVLCAGDDGIPRWLARPARLRLIDDATSENERQEAWVKGTISTIERVARLKALGNAVVPAQVYPVLKAIAEASQ